MIQAEYKQRAQYKQRAKWTPKDRFCCPFGLLKSVFGRFSKPFGFVHFCLNSAYIPFVSLIRCNAALQPKWYQQKMAGQLLLYPRGERGLSGYNKASGGLIKPLGQFNDTKEIQAEFKQKCTKPNGFENRPKTLFKAKWITKPFSRCPFDSLLVLCSLLVFSLYHYL